MVPNVNPADDFGFGKQIAKEWLVQSLIGSKSKDSSKEMVPALKPLAENTVYTVAEVTRR